VVGYDWDELSRDTQLLDLHWLHCKGFRRPMNDARYREVLTFDHFDQSKVEALVAEKWTSKVRIERFHLNVFEQWQVCTLRDDQLRKRLDGLLDEEQSVFSALRHLVQTGARLKIADAEGFASLWFARELTGGASQDVIATAYGWRRGVPPPTRSTISQKLRRMDDWLAKAGV
jgi:hypothetical protein